MKQRTKSWWVRLTRSGQAAPTALTFGQRKMTTDRTTRLVGVALIVAAVVGFFFASPEPTEIVPLPDGMATVIPRIPWGAIATEVAFVIGLGCVIASVVIRARMRT